VNVSAQRLFFDPAILALFYALTTGFTAKLVLLLGRLDGFFGKVEQSGSSKLASLEGLPGGLPP
jgi:hypothetical protein